MDLTCWWRIRKCQNNRIKYNQSKKCNWYHACVLQVEPLLWSMTVSPFSEEEKGILSQCWFCEKTAVVDTHTAPFPLQATLTSSPCLFTKKPWETQGRRLWKPSFCSRWWLGLWAMPSFSPAASLQSYWATSRDPHRWFCHIWPWPTSWFFFPLAFPHIMAAFVSRKSLSSLGCKFVYYIQRMALSTALCSTSVLSTYQSFTLTPRRLEWVMLRGRAPKFIGPSCCTCWILSLLMYIPVPLKIAGPQDTHNYTDSQGNWFCSISGTVTSFGYLWFISGAVFLTLMVWSSGSMVLLLLRHRQRVQYIHTPTGHHRCPPETRAAHTILMLVVTFIIVYILNSTFSFYLTVLVEFRLWLMQTSDVLASCFPTVSPFLLLLRDPKTPRICYGVNRNNA